ncbi:transposase, IS605 OrfB family, partial [mine drainage metagenome]
EADRWFVSLAVEVERALPAHPAAGDTIGVDLGVLSLATLSDGTVIQGPKALRRGLRQLRRLSRSHSRKTRGSHNRARAARRLARHHAKVAHLRRDHLHKLTTRLAKTHGRIVVEDLNVKGMLGNRQLARALSDSGFSEFRRQLSYKCQWYGSELVVA